MTALGRADLDVTDAAAVAAAVEPVALTTGLQAGVADSYNAVTVDGCTSTNDTVLLLASDVLGRIVVRPGELEVGIVTAFVGAPVFIALVRRRRLAQL